MTIQRKRVAKRLASGLLAGALALGGLAISGGSVSAKTPTTTSKRIQGSDRYSTALAIATNYVASANNATWAGSANIILASGENYPDALAAAALAKRVNAPIILTRPDALPSSVRDWLLVNSAAFTASATGKVYVVGGTAAVSEDVVTAVLSNINAATDLTPHTAVRLGGNDRYATAAAINAVAGLIDSTDAVILVNGSNYADAVSAGPLAYQAEWPIIPIKDGALDSNATATLTKIATAAAGAANVEVVIVGGYAAIPKSVEQSLVSLGMLPSSIQRYWGADRYQTALSLNAALYAGNGTLAGVHSQKMDGSQIALISGENFPDAIAAAPFLGLKGIHGQLTNSGSLNASASGLIAATAKTSAEPATLWAIGGTAALADAVVTAGVASAQSTNFVFSSMTCVEGSATVYLNYPPNKDSYKGGNAFGGSEATNINLAFTQDGTSESMSGAPMFVDQDGDGINDAIKVTLAAALAPVASSGGTTLAFAGVTEASGANGRSFGATSCTVAEDAVAPQLTLDARTDGSTAPTRLLVTGTENLTCTSNIDITKLSIGSTSPATANHVTVSALGTAKNQCQITLNPSIYPNTVAGTTVSAVAGFIGDVAGKDNAVAASTTFETDVTVPTVAASLVNCVATASVADEVFGTALKVSATAASSGGTKTGVPGNGYKLSVVSQRGLLIPTVTVDDAAKTIVVTADTGYHKAADVAQTVANEKAITDWTFAAQTSGLLTPTVVPVTTTGGSQLCTMTLIASETLSGSATVTSLVVNGLSLAADANTALADGEYSADTNLVDRYNLVTHSGSGGTYVLTFKPTTVVGSGSVVFAGALTDMAGNANSLISVVI